jgi:ubiquinone/menaquinone biosynthesis C-methylase UbiE
MARFQLPPKGMLQPNDSVDPLAYYYKPLIGRIFAARLDVGLGLLGSHYRKLLEVGYGSGLLLPTLQIICDELVALDREPEPPGLRDTLQRLGVRAKLVQGDLLELPFSEREFDAVVAFSILEHLKPDQLARAASEISRVLEPGGTVLVGCPAVHGAMNAAMAAIGFQSIKQHHFSSLKDVADAFSSHFTIEKRAAWPRLFDRAPLGWPPYGALLMKKR